MRKVYLVLTFSMLLCMACQWQLRPNDESSAAETLTIERYDRIETLYLTTGDYSALQQLNTRYPAQTRALIEDVLRIGRVNDPQINSQFLLFYQDSLLQAIIDEVERQYGNVDDLQKDLQSAFTALQKDLPGMEMPVIYTQIGALNQSIIVADSLLGISLDKYLGADYPPYRRYYPEEQRQQMVRSMIVPDCLGFYILSLYPMPADRELADEERHLHMGRIQWVVNRVLKKNLFRNEYVAAVEQYMKTHTSVSIGQLLSDANYAALLPQENK